jgi:hypothetical protein
MNLFRAFGPRRRAPILGAEFDVPRLLEDADEEAYEQAFRAWLAGVAARKLLLNKDAEPWEVDHFDGCSGIPDQARDCCGIHDIDYWFALNPDERHQADVRLRRCIVGKVRYDPAWGWCWWITGWIVFAGVQAAGWRFYGKGWKRSATSRDEA